MGKETLKNKEQSFEKSFETLEKLSGELQSNQISVDELVPRMKEAAEAISVCKDVLKETDSQLKKISTQFSQKEKEG